MPTGVGAVRICKRVAADIDGATTGRSLVTASPGREEPGDGGDGDARSVGARRRSRHWSGPCDGAVTCMAPRRAGRRGAATGATATPVGRSQETEPPPVQPLR